ncbi:MAG: DNA repair exonuclease [Chloroflexi bacterium]|nr:DNA repair exonuclease [Chloroflexota bacterium]
MVGPSRLAHPFPTSCTRTTAINSHSSRNTLRLLHAADLHLGSDASPEAGLQGLQAVQDALDRLPVDALLIAGDLFDALTVSPETVSHTFRVLQSLRVPVIVVPGNHDTALTSPLFSQHRLTGRVQVLLRREGELASVDSLGLSVWGRPVYEHSPSFRPLEGLAQRPQEGWYVAMAHGLVIEGAAAAGRSSPITRGELATADCDYVALGHVHSFRDVTCGGPPAYYSGAPSGARNRTAALVTLSPEAGVSVEAVHL